MLYSFIKIYKRHWNIGRSNYHSVITQDMNRDKTIDH